MAGTQRKGGIVTLSINGERQDVKGAVDYNPGRPKRDAVVGQDTVHGFKEVPQVALAECTLTDRGSLDLVALVELDNATIVIELSNGKTFVLRQAWFAGDGTANSEEGEIKVRFE